MVSAVAMARPSSDGDSTAAQGMPQRRNVKRDHKKTRPGKGFPATIFCQGEETIAMLGCRLLARTKAVRHGGLPGEIYRKARLCAPQKMELAKLALWGTHHMRRTHGWLLYIIFLPTKSISTGPT